MVYERTTYSMVRWKCCRMLVSHELPGYAVGQPRTQGLGIVPHEDQQCRPDGNGEQMVGDYLVGACPITRGSGCGDQPHASSPQQERHACNDDHPVEKPRGPGTWSASILSSSSVRGIGRGQVGHRGMQTLARPWDSPALLGLRHPRCSSSEASREVFGWGWTSSRSGLFLCCPYSASRTP